ncbi:DUF3987 domain-containing protein [uncultured Parabacteroides sp.]|uniref:DUF3987 domain-containing protein n=1 Tax=uncultured Parabacteroides sp. TaxID=512312 RepID=UPI00261E8A65|nr:DUF3987 domain-containing protein [uncultured Parabacteroides sp.]
MEQQEHVSFYPSLYQAECQVLTLEEIIILIRRRHWKNEIIAYRTAFTAGKAEEARKLKGGLPGFTPSGVFKGGHKADGLQEYSKIIGLDFDHVKDLTALIAAFRMLSCTLAMFVSPGGHGLKVFVRVDSDAGRHREAYRAVAAFYEKAGGVASDVKCKDISRCCYVSDDEEAYYNPKAEAFHVPEQPAAKVGVDAFVDAFLGRNPAMPGSRNETVYRLGCEANRRGFSYAETAACCTLRLQASDFTAAEIGQALSSAFQGNRNEHATFTERKGQKRAEKASATIPGTDGYEPDPEMSGERLREQTPFLPEELYGLLPPLLRDAVSYYSQRRERDMALLGACTVLSACLPEVFGFYHRKRVYPHLFTVEIAPAANGKGCINDMRHLADRYAGVIEAETGRAEEEYRQALEDWELKKAEAHKNHRAVSVKDAPKPAATAYLNIPTQITKAKLLVHLRDNGSIGGLMSDSEIDTIVSASKLDFGMFDDLLRKAFHHEPVASSRKTDNELIRIERPRLALLLAGTPGQFPRLVPDRESGLVSRLLLYTCRNEAVWQDVSPDGDGMEMEKKLAELSEQVMEAALTLRKRPLQIGLSTQQWTLLNCRFRTWLREADLFGSEEFLSVVKRYGLITFRLCMVFTALRCGTAGYGMDKQYCTDEHFRAALAITETCLEHSRLLLTSLHHDEDAPELSCPRKARSLLDKLPPEFTLQEAYRLGEAEGMGQREVRRFICKLTPLYFRRIAHGEYKRTGTPDPEKT